MRALRDLADVRHRALGREDVGRSGRGNGVRARRRDLAKGEPNCQRQTDHQPRRARRRDSYFFFSKFHNPRESTLPQNGQ